MKIKVIGTGLTGLVGSRIVELLEDRYEFDNISYESGIDITNKDQVEKKVVDSPAGVLLHLAAKADVDGCEKDRDEDSKKLKNQESEKISGLNTAWAVNVEGTRNIVEACQKSAKKIIYISTDFVFDGKNPPAGGYIEEDTPNPTNWYAKTKYEGEKIVVNSGLSYLICRIAFPYRASFAPKKDLVRGILEKLKNKQVVYMVTDEIITPTFIDDIAGAFDFLIKNDITGIYHVVGSSSHSPLELGHLIAQTFSLNESLIKETTRAIYFANRAARPFSLALKNDKLTKLGIKMSTFQEGLEKIKAQLL